MRISPLLLALAVLGCSSGYAQDRTSWQNYQEHFISEDGRVIDHFQKQMSHSEGQGYGMLLALLNDDSATFDRLWKWTSDNLWVRKTDALFAWSWGKRENGKWQVIDYNNASDGDVLIAFALLQGGNKWNRPSYKAAALTIIRSIRELLVAKSGPSTVLLPGYYGFSKPQGVVLNPSYWVFPAFRAFAQVDDERFWEDLYRGSMELVSKSTFTQFQLPADWILVTNGNASIYEERSRRFGDEAIRVLLYLCWDQHAAAVPGGKAMLDLYQKLGYLPASMDLVGEGISMHEASSGFYGIYGRLARDLGDATLSAELYEKAREKLASEPDNYYSHSLYLLSQGAWGP